jgi:hypothetical protein
MIRLPGRQSGSSLDGEGTCAASPQRGQGSPGLAVGDSVRSFMRGKVAHGSPAGNNRPRSDSPRVEELGASHRKTSDWAGDGR